MAEAAGSLAGGEGSGWAGPAGNEERPGCPGRADLAAPYAAARPGGAVRAGGRRRVMAGLTWAASHATGLAECRPEQGWVTGKARARAGAL